MKQFISLIEHNFRHTHVWHGTSKVSAKDLIDNGIDLSKVSGGYFGYGFYCADTPELAQSNYADWAGEENEGEKEEGVVLEYAIEDDARILDLRDEQDFIVWRDGKYERHLYDRNLSHILVRRGIDGVYDRSFDGICFYNPKALKFVRVYSGVVEDQLEEVNTNELDEVALGGLRRCTSVTVNALLKDFRLPPITLSQVPVDNPGVLNILNQKGLAYKPMPQETGRTVQQFVNTHQYNDWYLLTQGHAMALVKGELFDAENKGPDAARKLVAVYQISRR